MPRGLPPKVRIGYRDYEIESIPDQDKGKYLGWHYPQRHLIQLDFENIKPAELVNTYLHEIFHAMFSVIPNPFVKDENDADGFDQEERIVSYLGNAMSQFLKDNPDTVKWMLKQLNAKQL
jgi:hypothetical protein